MSYQMVALLNTRSSVNLSGKEDELQQIIQVFIKAMAALFNYKRLLFLCWNFTSLSQMLKQL